MLQPKDLDEALRHFAFLLGPFSSGTPQRMKFLGVVTILQCCPNAGAAASSDLLTGRAPAWASAVGESSAAPGDILAPRLHAPDAPDGVGGVGWADCRVISGGLREEKQLMKKGRGLQESNNAHAFGASDLRF